LISSWPAHLLANYFRRSTAPSGSRCHYEISFSGHFVRWTGFSETRAICQEKKLKRIRRNQWAIISQHCNHFASIASQWAVGPPYLTPYIGLDLQYPRSADPLIIRSWASHPAMDGAQNFIFFQAVVSIGVVNVNLRQTNWQPQSNRFCLRDAVATVDPQLWQREFVIWGESVRDHK
jgi:hypothetical protein